MINLSKFLEERINDIRYRKEVQNLTHENMLRLVNERIADLELCLADAYALRDELEMLTD